MSPRARRWTAIGGAVFVCLGALGFFRRTLVVDKGSQYTFLIYTMLISSIFIAFNIVVSLVLHTVLDPNSPYPVPAEVKIYVTMGLIAIGGLCMVLVSIAGALYLSNRFAGPVWRLNQFMKNVIAGGERKKLEFRKGDHFREVAETYNQLLQMMDQMEKEKNSR